MSKEICISSTPHETRLAILEDDQLAEIYYERENEYTLAGSIYKGRVTRVLPGMQSAFVEVGLERDAFLYVTDFLEEQGDSADFERVPGTRRDIVADQPAAQVPERPNQNADLSSVEEPRSDRGQQGSRESGQPRSRGRGRNRGRGDRTQDRTQDPRQGGRSETQAVAPQPVAVEPFDSASIAPGSRVAEPGTEADSYAGHTDSGFAPADTADQESPEGTRRWRGRRGRRGGSRTRDPREQEASSASRQPMPPRPVQPPAAFPSAAAYSESEPIPARVDAISGAQTSVASGSGRTAPAAAPIVLPGESISKYGHSSAPVGRGSERPAAALSSANLSSSSVTARPSTLIEAPISWDGSGLLLGETISRYRKTEDAPAAIPASSSAHHSASSQESNAKPVPDAREQSVFETAYSETPHAEGSYNVEDESQPAETSQGFAEGSTVEDEEIIDGSEQLTEEVTTFEPEEASASYRIDPAPPIEFRVASPAEEQVEELVAEHGGDRFEAPVAFHSVAPEEPVQAPEGRQNAGLEDSDHSFATDPFASEAFANSATPEDGGQQASLRQNTGQQIHDDRAIQNAASPEEAPSEMTVVSYDGSISDINPPTSGHQPAESHHSSAKPEGFWQAVKELVTGHAREEAQSKHEGDSHSETVPPAAEYPADAPEQSLAVRYEEGQQEQQKEADLAHAHVLAEEVTRANKDPEPLSRQQEEAGEHLAGVPAFDNLNDESAEDEGTAQGFAPGSGLIEEETIEEEEYDYEPIHAGADDHDLEDLEEETLEHQGGVELGEMVRDAHLEQRVKGNGVVEDGSDEYGEDASGGFTEEDFEGTPLDGEEGGEEESPLAAAPSDSRRDSGRNGERPGDNRRGDRGRGRGRRPGPGGPAHGGSRRQNTQASDLPVISELLKQGQEILVQIAKEPIAKKGARITSHIALPGRFLVFMPTVNHVGVSRKISSDEERQRLKSILVSEKGNAAGGFIVRTAADGASEEDLRADIRFLLSLWSEIKQRSDEAKAPALIYHDLNLIERVLRDQVSDNFSAIWVDSETEYERIVRFLQRFQPSLVRRVKLYTKETPLFEQFGIQEEISKALKSKVWLKSGGSIVINQTEALVAIDINTGKFVGKTARLEDTILRTNLDAIPEIVRQIRLRDLGGIIVIDFIDMDERKNRNRVLQALEDELKHDRAPSKVLPFNDFGLVAITRKRVKQSLERTLSVQCEVCTGTGMVKSPTTVCNEIYTEMRKMHRTLERKDALLRVHPEVVKALKSTNGRWLNELEEMTGKTIIVKSDPALHPEQFDIH